MYQHFCTTDVPVGEAAEFWCSAISKAYFDLQLHFQTVQQFRAQLDVWSLGLVSLSRLESSALHYSRRPQKPPTDRSSQQPQLLLTVPLNSSVEFTQLGRHTRCEPGQFVLEHGHEPYEFSHSAHNTMWVLKIPEAALQARTGPTDRFCALPFRSVQLHGSHAHAPIDALEQRLCELEQQGLAAMQAEGVPQERILFKRSLDMRYVGQVHECSVVIGNLPVNASTLEQIKQMFHDQHQQLFTYSEPENTIEIVNIEATVYGQQTPLLPPSLPPGGQAEAAIRTRRMMIFDTNGQQQLTPVYDGEKLGAGDSIAGPAVIEEPTTTVVIQPGWTALLHPTGSYVITRNAAH